MVRNFDEVWLLAPAITGANSSQTSVGQIYTGSAPGQIARGGHCPTLPAIPCEILPYDFVTTFLFFLLCSHTQLINNTEDNGTETRTYVTTTEKGLHRVAAVMVGH